MKLTAKIDAINRIVAFREAYSLVAGELYEPLILDFSECSPSVVSSIEGSTLVLELKKSRTGSVVASCPMFSPVPNHRLFRQATLDLASELMNEWYREEASQAKPARVSVEGWLEVRDALRTYVACPVPVVLRDVTVRGDSAGYYTASQVDELLKGKNDKLVFDEKPTAGSSNPVKSNGVHSALEEKASKADLLLKADIAALDALAGAVASKADVSLVTAVSNAVNALQSTVDLKLNTADLEARGYVTGDWVRDYSKNFATVDSVLSEVKSLGYVTERGVTSLLSTKVDQTYFLETVNTLVLRSELGSYASIAYVADELSKYAKSDDIADQIANAGFLDSETLTEVLSGYATVGALDAKLTGYATLTRLGEDVNRLTQAISEKPSVSTVEEMVNAAVVTKADKDQVYTKSEIDALLPNAAGGGGGGQPGVTLLDETLDSLNIYSPTREQTLGYVVLLERDTENNVSRIVVRGQLEFAGDLVLTARGGWVAHSSEDGVVRFNVERSTFEFESPTAGVETISVVFPQSVGTPLSDLADVFPKEGNYDRAVSSGGVYEMLYGEVAKLTPRDLHDEDLAATHLLIAQNATSAAAAVRATTQFVNILLDLETRYVSASSLDAKLALKQNAFSPVAPLYFNSEGRLALDVDTFLVSKVFTDTTARIAEVEDFVATAKDEIQDMAQGAVDAANEAKSLAETASQTAESANNTAAKALASVTGATSSTTLESAEFEYNEETGMYHLPVNVKNNQTLHFYKDLPSTMQGKDIVFDVNLQERGETGARNFVLALRSENDLRPNRCFIRFNENVVVSTTYNITAYQVPKDTLVWEGITSEYFDRESAEYPSMNLFVQTKVYVTPSPGSDYEPAGIAYYKAYFFEVAPGHFASMEYY